MRWLVKEHTIGADPFKGGKREGVIKMDKRSPHTFEAEITKIHDLGK